jgi:HEAT repeats
MKRRFPGFKKCMAMMRKHDPQIQEDGFHWLLPYAGDYVQELIEEFSNEKGHGLRCWILELVGSAKSPDAYNFLATQLQSDDEALRSWAVWGLKNLGTSAARTLLRQVRLAE